MVTLKLTSIYINWCQLTNVTMTSIVIFASSLTTIDLTRQTLRFWDEFDVFWRSMTICDIFWLFKKIQKKIWRKLMKIDDNWRQRKFFLTSIDAWRYHYYIFFLFKYKKKFYFWLMNKIRQIFFFYFRIFALYIKMFSLLNY